MKLQRVSSNLSRQVKVRQLDGRNYWVVPVTSLIEGVHSGSDGPVLYRSREIEKYAPAWNHKPVVVYHPKRADGTYMSADDDAVLNTSQVGILMRSRGADGRLRNEAWIEQEKARRVDPRIEEAISRGLKMEVSTGLFVDLQRKKGTWNGERFNYIARNFRPDHLALLPDMVGACSIADGCGLLQVNNRVSFRKALRLQDIVDEILACNCEDCSNCEKCKELLMKVDKKQKALVNSLIEGGRWTEDDREFLEGLDECKLSKIVSNEEDDEEDEKKEKPSRNTRRRKLRVKLQRNRKSANKEEKKIETPTQNEDESKKGTPCSQKPEEPAKPVTLQEYVKNAPPEIREYLVEGMSELKERKEQLIEQILDNEQNEFEEEQLATFNTSMLKKLAALAKSAKQESPEDEDSDPIYLGNAGKRFKGSEEDDTLEALELPSTERKDEKRSA